MTAPVRWTDVERDDDAKVFCPSSHPLANPPRRGPAVPGHRRRRAKLEQCLCGKTAGTFRAGPIRLAKWPGFACSTWRLKRPGAAPQSAPRYEKDVIDGSFVVGSLVRPQVEEEPEIPEGEVAGVLDAADLIVTAAGPEDPEGDRTQTGDQALVEGLEAERGRRAGLERPLTISGSSRALAGLRSRKQGRGGAIVLLVGAVMAGCSSSRPPARPKVTPTSVTQTTKPSSSALYNWQRAESPSLALGGGSTSTLSSVVAPGPGGDWLIAGTQFTPTGGSVPTVWTSPNTVDWHKAALAWPAGTVAASADAATNWDGGQVVVGSAGTGANMRAAVWVSPRGGQRFQAVANNPAFDSPAAAVSPALAGAVMDDVTAGACWACSPPGRSPANRQCGIPPMLAIGRS